MVKMRKSVISTSTVVLIKEAQMACLKRILLLIVALAMVLFFGASQGKSAAVLPDIKKAVTFIFFADAQGNLLRDPKTNLPIPDGTGFFVVVNTDPPSTSVYGYLVTAKHVLRDPIGGAFYKRIYVRLNPLNGEDAKYVSVDLNQNGVKNLFLHSDQ